MEQRNGITEGKCTIKSGKLLKLKAQFKNKKIVKIKITGDFFIYPENTIENLERSLEGVSIEDSRKIIEKALKDCEYIGIDPETLHRAVMEAWMKRK